MPRTGEIELSGVPQKQERKYRHNNVYQPKTTSKSFQRKLSSLESGWKKEGKDVAAAKKEYLDTFKNVAKESTVKSELKSSMQIAKSRQEKDKRRLKTGRHHASKMGSSNKR
jgi:ATP-dependent RNA helicase DDX54/DBP10